MFRVLPPVGEPILLGPGRDPPEFPRFHAIWTQSGTAALALAVQMATARRSGVAHPEVLIPGYGCPDLVAAVRFAGARPVLVDIGAEDPGFNLESLEQAWTDATVAVVAVNFLGIRERVQDLAPIAKARNAWLIEDSAQWYPEAPSDEDVAITTADAMILSFGRGKPVSLLGGGCLLLNRSYPVPQGVSKLDPLGSSKALSMKLRTYNFLLKPEFYGWIARLPWLAIGATQYRPLKKIGGMDELRLRLLSANVSRHMLRKRRQEQSIMGICAPLPDGFVDLPRILVSRTGRLLRYPVLCSSLKKREEILDHSRRMGLGMSSMYGCALPEIEGVAEQLNETPDICNARAFADRLLTLPVHSGLLPGDVVRMSKLFHG